MKIDYTWMVIALAAFGLFWAVETLIADADAGGGEKNSERKKWQPIMEAPLPEGFPGPGPLGEVVVKGYPAHRAACAEPQRLSSTFMRLFRHITKHEIPMSSPVQMTMGDDGGMTSMAFFYVKPATGETGPDETVVVRDVPAGKAVSVGVRGKMNRKVRQAHEKMLRDWLSEHTEYGTAGPTRVMGYNSPFIPTRDKYHEVQIPIAEVKREEDRTE